jgi:hypothetical protein
MDTISLISALDGVIGKRHASPALSLGKSRHPLYRVERKSLTTPCKSQNTRNRWITTICDLIRPWGKSFGGVTLTAAIL